MTLTPETMKHVILGSVFGVAVGDAMGIRVEGMQPTYFEQIVDTERVQGGRQIDYGIWTDDTAMTLCTIESMLVRLELDEAHLASMFTKWQKEGYLSATGECIGIGNTTKKALYDFKKTGNPLSGGKGEWDQGNGSLMRIAPIGLFYNDPKKVVSAAAVASSVTHAHEVCIDACQYLARIIFSLTLGNSRREAVANSYTPATEQVRAIWNAHRQFAHPTPRSTGYVLDTLNAALYCFLSTNSFKDAILRAVNLGGDADTVAAVTGALAGANYGIDEIPTSWVVGLLKWDMIYDLAMKLWQHRISVDSPTS